MGIDFSYDVPDLARFRANVVRQRKGHDAVFRIINTKVRTMDELGLPEQLKVLTQYHNGLVLVTGAVGSGKSTTLASMVQEVNTHRSDHIITLEDPIEYVFVPAGCQITQREVHAHTESFRGRVARPAFREDPDVIIVREMHLRLWKLIQPGHHRIGNRSLGHRHAPHQQRRPHPRPRPRRLPRGTAGTDPHHGERIAARHRQPAA